MFQQASNSNIFEQKTDIQKPCTKKSTFFLIPMFQVACFLSKSKRFFLPCQNQTWLSRQLGQFEAKFHRQPELNRLSTNYYGSFNQHSLSFFKNTHWKASNYLRHEAIFSAAETLGQPNLFSVLQNTLLLVFLSLMAFYTTSLPTCIFNAI